MNPSLKKYIKLLSQRFKHEISYQADTIFLASPMNSIRISLHKDHVMLTYNVPGGEKEMKLTENNFLDLLVEILRRWMVREIPLKNNYPLTVDQYLQQEGARARKEMEDLEKAIVQGNAHNKILFGNRYEAEYYEGILILTDDLGYLQCNVIEMNA